MYLSISRLFGEVDVEPESTNSSDSGLLKLSAELRLLIYKHVFQGELIHLSKNKTGLKSAICRKAKCRTCDRRTRCPLHRTREENVDPTGGDSGNDYNSPTQDGAQVTAFSILRTCHQIYEEASHVMDSEVTFDVSHMAAWISFCQTFPRGRLARIRRLHIHYKTRFIPGIDNYPTNAQYCEFWGLVAFCMPALRHLHFCMDCTTLGRFGAQLISFDKRWPNWAVPILYVRGLWSCELTVNVNHPAFKLIPLDEYDFVPLRRDCLEEMKCIMCRQADRKRVDLSDLFLRQTFPQGDRDALRAILKESYLTMIPQNLERRVQVSDVSIGILRSELYQPDRIPAHRDNPDLTRKRADGNLYVKDTIDWLVQKGDELPVLRRIMMERVARKQKHLSKIGHGLEIYTSDKTMESYYGKDHPKNQGALHSDSKPLRMPEVKSYRVQQTVGHPGSDSEEVQIRKTWFKLPFEVVFQYDGYKISVSASLSLDWDIHAGASPLVFELREPLDWVSMGVSEDRLLSI